MVASAVNPALDLLSRTLLATPSLATGSRARELWLVSLGLADAAYVLLVTIGGVVLLAHESLQTQYSVKEVAPRLVVGAIAANLSLILAREGIELANAASAALLGQQVNPASVTSTIRTLALAPLEPGSLFTALLLGVLVVLAVVLAGTCVVRAMLVVFLVVAAPVMLAAHALPQTEGLARLWWRAMVACLGVQLAQALALVMAVRVFFEADQRDVLPLGGGHLVDVMVACCLLWLLIRIPAWAARAVVDGGRRSAVVRLVRSVVVVRTLRAVHHVIGGADERSENPGGRGAGGPAAGRFDRSAARHPGRRRRGRVGCRRGRPHGPAGGRCASGRLDGAAAGAGIGARPPGRAVA